MNCSGQQHSRVRRCVTEFGGMTSLGKSPGIRFSGRRPPLQQARYSNGIEAIHQTQRGRRASGGCFLVMSRTNKNFFAVFFLAPLWFTRRGHFFFSWVQKHSAEQLEFGEW